MKNFTFCTVTFEFVKSNILLVCRKKYTDEFLHNYFLFFVSSRHLEF